MSRDRKGKPQIDSSSAEEVVAYLANKYPRPEELSRARLKFMVYLADWKSAIEHKRQLTPLTWEFGEYGPYNPSLARLVENTSQSREGSPESKGEHSTLGKTEREVLDFIVGSVEKKDFAELTKLVYSTHPFITQPRCAKFDLVSLAKDYEQIKPLIGT